ncbi:MAG: hypothetical protein J4415_00245 [Candidatus Diapherotrites archaeon]|uniref:DOD-type homing endonuclease domain-containing protein n=1 Tax=Candidatus Iainarchaeum sp. TaxID=3101447 RepID=A0A8T4KVA1_9ARCH|nr:hypothetical protein [Candidatus Diapherotrites archaeon]
MDSISNEKISQISFLRSKGASYKKIARTIGVASATASKYGQHIILSENYKKQLIENENKNRERFARTYAKEKEISLPNLDENLASVLGHLFFDGNVSKFNGKYILQYTNSSEVAIKQFIKKVSTLFSIAPAKIQTFKNKNIWYQVYFYSKKAVMFVERYSKTFSTKQAVGVPPAVMSASDNIKSAFLRAFWDDEGSISKVGYICGCSKSEPMINDLVVMHELLGVNCTKRTDNKKGSYTIYILNNIENIINFSKKVGFEYGLITKGINSGRYKKDVLNETLERRLAFNSLH